VVLPRHRQYLQSELPLLPNWQRQDADARQGSDVEETFDIILRKIEPHARFVCLFNWGEPFLNKNLLYMVRALSERGIKSHLDSNLSLRDFSDREAQEIVRSGLFSLFASIDGVTQESYEKYRVGGNVERALGNCDSSFALATASGWKPPACSGRSISIASTNTRSRRPEKSRKTSGRDLVQTALGPRRVSNSVREGVVPDSLSAPVDAVLASQSGQ